MIEQVKINHDFCTIKWFFIAQKDRCGMLLALHAISQHFLSRKILSILAPIYRKVKTRKR